MSRAENKDQAFSSIQNGILNDVTREALPDPGQNMALRIFSRRLRTTSIVIQPFISLAPPDKAKHEVTLQSHKESERAPLFKAIYKEMAHPAFNPDPDKKASAYTEAMTVKQTFETVSQRFGEESSRGLLEGS